MNTVKYDILAYEEKNNNRSPLIFVLRPKIFQNQNIYI